MCDPVPIVPLCLTYSGSNPFKTGEASYAVVVETGKPVPFHDPELKLSVAVPYVNLVICCENIYFMYLIYL